MKNISSTKIGESSFKGLNTIKSLFKKKERLLFIASNYSQYDPFRQGFLKYILKAFFDTIISINRTVFNKDMNENNDNFEKIITYFVDYFQRKVFGTKQLFMIHMCYR